MKLKEINEVRVGKRNTIRPGDKIRARGGPIFQTEGGNKRIGDPGLYEVRRLFRKRERIFAECARLDKIFGDARVPSGIYTLFIQGKPFRSKVLDTIVNKPYRVSKVRAS